MAVRKKKPRPPTIKVPGIVLWDEILGSMSHDIKNPLHVITSCSEVVDDSLSDTDPTQKKLKSLVKTIYDAAFSLNSVIELFLSHTRTYFTLQENVPFAMTLERALKFMERKFRQSEIRIQQQTSASGLSFYGDPTTTEHAFIFIFYNLIQRLKMMPGACITITVTQPHASELAIAIQDNSKATLKAPSTPPKNEETLRWQTAQRLLRQGGGKLVIKKGTRGADILITLPRHPKKSS